MALAMNVGGGAHSQPVSGAGPWYLAYSWKKACVPSIGTPADFVMGAVREGNTARIANMGDLIRLAGRGLPAVVVIVEQTNHPAGDVHHFFLFHDPDVCMEWQGEGKITQ